MLSPSPAPCLTSSACKGWVLLQHTEDASLHGCYRLLLDELFGFRHSPVPLACFCQDTYCCSYSSTSPAALQRLGSPRVQENGLFYSLQPGEATSRAPIGCSPGLAAPFLADTPCTSLPWLRTWALRLCCSLGARAALASAPLFAWARGTDGSSRWAAALPRGLGEASHQQQRMGQHGIALNAERRGGDEHSSQVTTPPPQHPEGSPWTAKGAQCRERLLAAAPGSWDSPAVQPAPLGSLRGKKASAQPAGAELSPSEGSS